MEQPPPSDTPSASAEVATLLRMELARRRISQAQFARTFGMNGQWVWRRLSGETPMTLDDLDMFASLLDLDAAELLRQSIEKAQASA